MQVMDLWLMPQGGVEGQSMLNSFLAGQVLELLWTDPFQLFFTKEWGTWLSQGAQPAVLLP